MAKLTVARRNFAKVTNIHVYNRLLGQVRVAPCGQDIVSVCVPRWPLQVYQLRSAVRRELYQLRPGLSTPNMMSCVPRLVRNCFSCIGRHRCTKCPKIGRFLQFYCTSLYTKLYIHMQNCWMISTAQLLNHVTLLAESCQNLMIETCIWIMVDQLDDTCFIIYCSTCFRL